MTTKKIDGKLFFINDYRKPFGVVNQGVLDLFY